jgi:hypothetical protein
MRVPSVTIQARAINGLAEQWHRLIRLAGERILEQTTPGRPAAVM